MQVYVYKSLRRSDTYLYLGQRDDFQVIPAALNSHLGQLQFVLETTLTEHRRLPRADVLEVIDRISNVGYFLQLPPKPESNVSVDD